MISGHKVQFGVDTSANPSLINGRILATEAVNRIFRGGDNDTRPAFQLLNLQFTSEEERELFETRRLTSLYGYNGILPYTQPFIIATVGKNVWAGNYLSKNVLMQRIYSDLDDSLMQHYPLQAETLLIINDGKNDPIFWNGQVSQMRKCKDSAFSKAPMPIGNIATYCHGRIFIATQDGTVFAGDHLYSQVGVVSDETVLSFQESTYPVSGDGFTAPASFGPLTGIKVVGRNPSTNGHGEIIVYHHNGAYAIDPIDDRSKWTQQQIQQIVFVGRGGASPFSVIAANNDHFFRCSDTSIASLKITIAERNDQFMDRPISEEVEKYLSYDDNPSIRYAMSGFEGNRVFFSVNHQFQKVNEIVHRFALGLVSIDLYRGSNATGDKISWDGLWTGPRITGMAQFNMAGGRKCIFSSFDSDGKNRLYTLSRFRGDDLCGSGIRKIKSMYVVGGLFDGLSVDSANTKQTTVRNNAVFYSDCVGQAKLSLDYSPGYSSNWYNMYKNKEIGLYSGNDNFLFDVSSNAFKGDAPCSVTENTGERTVSSYVFAIRTCIEGAAKIKCNILIGDQKEMSLSYSKACPKEAGYQVDSYNNFNYTF